MEDNQQHFFSSKKQKNSIEILVDQAVLKLIITTVKIHQYLKSRLACLNSNAIFEFLGQFTLICINHLKNKG